MIKWLPEAPGFQFQWNMLFQLPQSSFHSSTGLQPTYVASCCWPKHSQANWLENERATRRARGVNSPPAVDAFFPSLVLWGMSVGFTTLAPQSHPPLLLAHGK